MGSILGRMQTIGKALMLPIAVLPAAAIFLRLGAGVPEIGLGKETWLAQILFQAGNSIFSHLDLLFGIGVAVAIAKGRDGAAALAGLIGVFVTKSVYGAIDSNINAGVFVGILMGLIAGNLYNRYYKVKLPDYLAFFGGKRFVPVVTSFVAVLVGVMFGFVWPFVQLGIDNLGNAAIGAGVFGTFFFGLANRLLLPFGLHHILNNIFWFNFGSFENAAGEIIKGDLSRYLAGDPTAGIYMAGWYPIMMFALPALAYAIYRSAKPANRKVVGGIMFSVAFTSFLTGVTEPIEFLFCFTAPFVYFIHAVLTGAALAVTHLLDIHHGFGFSAGFIDYLMNFYLSKNALWLLPIGIIFAVVYYFLFRYLIVRFNISVPGRGNDVLEKTGKVVSEQKASSLAQSYFTELGGRDNIVEVDSCITRLRMVLRDTSTIDDVKLKNLGAHGVIRSGKQHVQVVIGTQANLIAEEIKELLE